VAPLRSHDQNRHPRPFQTVTCPACCLLFSLTVSRRTSPQIQVPYAVHMGLASLCIANRVHFIHRTLRSVCGKGSRAIRSSSSSAFANPSSCRHTSPLPSQRLAWPFPIRASRGHPNARTLSWAAKFNLRRPRTPLNDADTIEDVAKEAVLEAIKGRQQTDLMLRCESLVHRDMVVSQTGSNSSLIGTILDADGTPSGSYGHDHSSGVPIMRGFMSLRRMALRVNNDVPRVFLPPPCQAHAPPTFRSGTGKRLICIL
jgi:hypothetical protein